MFKIILASAAFLIGALALANGPQCVNLFDGKQLAAEVKNIQALVDPNILRVAAVQYPLAEGRSARDFYAKMSTFIQEAKNNGAQLVVFPELVTTELIDWSNENYVQQLRDVAANFTPRYIHWLQTKARELQISILGGTTPRVVNGQIYNTAVVALPDGTSFLQDKLFLTPDEKEWNWTPGTALKVFNAPWGKTVITTCFDCEFPMVSQLVAKVKPELILVPSWTSSESGLNRVDWTAKSRAVEHFSFVVKTGTVPDPASPQIHFGKASIITPQDKGFPTTVIEGNLNESVIVYGNLDMQKLNQRRQDTGYYPVKEQEARTAPLTLEE